MTTIYRYIKSKTYNIWYIKYDKIRLSSEKLFYIENNTERSQEPMRMVTIYRVPFDKWNIRKN